jgi:hypothetical protein
VAQPEKRLHELQRLGFARAVVARTARDGSAVAPIDVLAVSQVGEVAALLGPPGKIGAKNRFD